MDLRNRINNSFDYSKRPDFIYSDFFTKYQNSENNKIVDKIDSNGRKYYVPGTDGYPSVTTILSSTKSEKDKEILERWKNEVGEEKAAKILKDAGDRGSTLHNLCENFILNNEWSVPEKNTNSFALWKQVYPSLYNDVNNIHLVEGCLYSHKLKAAGRTDLIAEYKNELAIIDFKTTIKEKQAEWIEGYYIQESFYALMFWEMYGIRIKKIVTIMARDNDFHGKADIFIENPDNYYKKVIERVKQYYNAF